MLDYGLLIHICIDLIFDDCFVIIIVVVLRESSETLIFLDHLRKTAKPKKKNLNECKKKNISYIKSIK